MSKKILITEEQLKIILSEELGIAEKVVEITELIENKINKLFLQKKYKGTYKILDDLKLNFKYINFPNYNNLNSWLQTNIKQIKNGFSFKNKTIYLTVIAVNNSFDTDELRDTIQHEVCHYYQSKLRGKSFESDTYQAIVRNMNTGNGYIDNLNKILYFSKNFEMEGWINGAFNAHREKKITTYHQFIKNTELYKIDGILKDAFDFFKNKPFDGYRFQQMLIFIHKNKIYSEYINLKELRYKILKDCQKTYDMFVRKSSRAFALLKKQYEDNIKKNNNSISIKDNI